MKHLLSLVTFLLVTSGLRAAERTYDVTTFTAIDASGAAVIVYTCSPTHSVRAEGEAKDIERYTVSVRGGTLTIRTNKKHNQWRNINRVTFYVTSPELTAIELSGACHFDADQVLSASDLKLDLSGASKLEANIAAKGKMDIDVSGASKVAGNLLAEADVSFDMSGASKATLKVKAHDINLDISDACRSSLNVECHRLTAECSGASKLTLAGKAVGLRLNKSGAANCDHSHLRVP